MASALSFALLVVLALQIHVSWVSGYAKKCYMKKADVLFILDESTSIKLQDFEKQKTFVNELIDTFNVGQDGTRVALIAYATRPRSLAEFSMTKDKAGIKRRVQSIKMTTGDTHTWEALSMARTRSFTKGMGSRLDDKTVPKITIVITDGNSQEPDNTAKEGQNLRRARAGVTVYAIGVGNDVESEELLNIAGDSSRVFRASSYSKLKGLENTVLDAACVTEAPPTLPPIPIYKSCKNKKADVLFVMDGSKNANFEGMKGFLSELAMTLDISASDTRAGLITYGKTAKLQFGFNQYKSREEVYQSILGVKGDGSSTSNLMEALKMANQQSFNPSKGGRTKLAKVLVLITAGKSSDSAQSKQMARRLMGDRGVKIIAIAVASASMRELSSIAGADSVVQVGSVAKLSGVRNQVAGRICDSNPPQSDFACGEYHPIDLAFVMNTPSAGGHDMVYSSNFLQKAADKFDISPRTTQISVVPAQCQTLPGFNLKKYSTKATLKAGMKLGQSVSLGNLMTQVTTETFTAKNGARSASAAYRFIVIVTDGKPDQATIQKAKQAKAKGIQVFVVGVGKAAKSANAQLVEMATSARHVYHAASFQKLESDRSIVDGIATTICSYTGRQ